MILSEVMTTDSEGKEKYGYAKWYGVVTDRLDESG
jgi:hypothetical protein